MGLLTKVEESVVEDAVVLTPRDYARVDRVEDDVLWAVIDGFTVLAQKPNYEVVKGQKIAKKDIVLL